MMLAATDITTLLTYGFLYLTVLGLWVPKWKGIPLWGCLFAVSTVFGLISKRLDFIAVIYMVLLAIFTHYLGHQKTAMPLRVLSALALLVLAVGLETLSLPGFHNLQVLDQVKISQDGIPFSLSLNFDKTMVGIFILGVLHQRIATQSAWGKMFKTMLPMVLFLIISLIGLSFLCHYVRFDPKLPASWLIWSCTNLLFVCVAEEGLFRGFIQKYLCALWQHWKYGYVLAITIAAVLFGLAHYAGGVLYVLLATVAGLGYGFIYFRTQRIEASILTHFLLNLVHFLLFTYPALAASVSP